MTISRPIKTQAEYDTVLAQIDRLMDAPENSVEADHLELLSILVEAYEAEHYPIDATDPIEAIKFRMEQAGLTRKDLEPYVGGRARVAEILNRIRLLSLTMIRRLNAGLGIPLDSLVQPYQMRTKAAKKTITRQTTKSPRKRRNGGRPQSASKM